MRRPYLGSLGLRLAGLVLVAIAPALVLVFLAGRGQRRGAESEAWAEARALARLAADRQDLLVEEARSLLAVLARSPEVRGRDTDAADRLFADILRQHERYANIGLVDATGALRASGVPMQGRVHAADKAWFQRVLRHGDFAVGDYQIGRITGVPVLVFAVPILDVSGAVDGAVFAALDLAWLSELVSALELPRGFEVTLTDRSGIVLARYPEAGAWVGRADTTAFSTAASASGRAGARRAIGMDGVERYYLGQRLRPAGSAAYAELRVGLPVHAVLGRARSVMRSHIAVILALGAFGLVLVWFGTWLLVLRPARRLVAVAERWKQGDLAARSGAGAGSGEIAHLARAFDAMAAGLEARARDTERAGRALADSEKRFRRIVDSGMLGIVFWDESGGAIKANERFLALVGATPADVEAGRLRHEALTPAEFAPRDARCREELDAAGVCTPYEKELLRADGERVPVLVGAARLDERSGQTVSFVLDMSQQRQAEARLRASREQLRALSGRIQAAREEERKIVAREIHDELGQRLTGLKLDVAALARRVPQGAELAHRARGMSQAIDAMIESVRLLATQLRPGVLDTIGLAAAVEWQAAEFERRTGIRCSVHQDLGDRAVHEEARTAMFRIFQEALTNVVRHARARSVHVTLRLEDGILVLSVLDDGRGIEDEAVDSVRSLGLLGMRERAALVGGDVRVAARREGGTAVEARVPLAGAAMRSGGGS